LIKNHSIVLAPHCSSING